MRRLPILLILLCQYGCALTHAEPACPGKLRPINPPTLEQHHEQH